MSRRNQIVQALQQIIRDKEPFILLNKKRNESLFKAKKRQLRKERSMNRWLRQSGYTFLIAKRKF